MFSLGDTVKHLKTGRNGVVRVVNTVSNKMKIQYHEGDFCSLQSIDNFMMIAAQREQRQRSVSFEPPVQEPLEMEQAKLPTVVLWEQMISTRVPYETILPAEITFDHIYDRHKYPLTDLSLLGEEEYKRRQEMRDLLPEVDKAIWPHLFRDQSHLWGFRPSDHKRKRVEVSTDRKVTKEEVEIYKCAKIMRDLQYTVGMIGGSCVMYP